VLWGSRVQARDNETRTSEAWVARVRVVEAQNTELQSQLALLRKQIDSERAAHADSVSAWWGGENARNGNTGETSRAGEARGHVGP